MNPVYAHSIEGRPTAAWEPMADHESAVASLSGRFLQRVCPSWIAWGEVLGRWHDLGKYQPAFQAKLHQDGIKRTGVDHAAIGAALAQWLAGHSADQRVPAGYAIAFAIAGHHTGLANASAECPTVARLPLSKRIKQSQPQLHELLPAIPGPIREIPIPDLPDWLIHPASHDEGKQSYAFFTRNLFSALVDADRLATAEFYANAEGRVPEHDQLQYDTLATLRDRLDSHIDALCARAAASGISPVNALRAEVLAACRAKATEPPGIFTLTVPTGGAKTLSAMSFALRHAVLHGLDRVIVVIPFTSIIEQNAARYRDALGENGRPDDRNVLEHHSGIDELEAENTNKEAELRRRSAAENWDAPVVVSTSVQFFESLFSDHPSRCRKLHRIAKSVIILDEVQTLPPGLLLPILQATRELAEHYGSTIVLSTATPPALARRNGFPEGLTGVRSIIDDPVALANRPAARRVEIEWRIDRVTSYESLAQELADHKQVLAIVHRRRDARVLAEKLPVAGRFHLSANMCPAHRLARLDDIYRRLDEGGQCRIVATQLIEAGVDIDLPVVYRALAGLDSVAQAAGRCDREGKLSSALGHAGGRTIVFRAETEPPPGILRKAAQSTETLLSLLTGPDQLDPFNPEHCELFFRELYGKESLDARNILPETEASNFTNVAAAFRMIEDDWSRVIAVPWGDGLGRIEAFLHDPSRQNRRGLQPFLVQAARYYVDELARQGVVERWEESELYLPTCLFGDRYSEEFGLNIALDKGIDPEICIV